MLSGRELVFGRWILSSKLRFIHFQKVHPQVYQNTIGAPLIKGPKGPGGGVKVLTSILGHFLLIFKVLLLSQFQTEMVHFQYGAIKLDLLEGPYSKTEPSENFY